MKSTKDEKQIFKPTKIEITDLTNHPVRYQSIKSALGGKISELSEINELSKNNKKQVYFHYLFDDKFIKCHFEVDNNQIKEIAGYIENINSYIINSNPIRTQNNINNKIETRTHMPKKTEEFIKNSLGFIPQTEEEIKAFEEVKKIPNLSNLDETAKLNKNLELVDKYYSQSGISDFFLDQISNTKSEPKKLPLIEEKEYKNHRGSRIKNFLDLNDIWYKMATRPNKKNSELQSGKNNITYYEANSTQLDKDLKNIVKTNITNTALRAKDKIAKFAENTIDNITNIKDKITEIPTDIKKKFAAENSKSQDKDKEIGGEISKIKKFANKISSGKKLEKFSDVNFQISGVFAIGAAIAGIVFPPAALPLLGIAIATGILGATAKIAQIGYNLYSKKSNKENNNKDISTSQNIALGQNIEKQLDKTKESLDRPIETLSVMQSAKTPPTIPALKHLPPSRPLPPTPRSMSNLKPDSAPTSQKRSSNGPNR